MINSWVCSYIYVYSEKNRFFIEIIPGNTSLILFYVSRQLTDPSPNPKFFFFQFFGGKYIQNLNSWLHFCKIFPSKSNISSFDRIFWLSAKKLKLKNIGKIQLFFCLHHFLFYKNNFIRTRASDFSEIKNNLSLISEKLRTKTHFSLK